MSFLVITDPLPPGFQLGPLQLRFYGIAYVIAFVVGTAVAHRHLARRGVPPSVTSNIAFWAIVFGLIGARLYFVVQSGWFWYLTHPQHIFAFWEGGMAFFQLIVFYWRTDSETPAILWGLKQAQLTSLAVLVVVVPIFAVLWWRSRRRPGAVATVLASA